MFGFFFGAVCLGGLAALLFHRRRHGYLHHSNRHGCGHRFGRGRAGLDYVLDRLDTRPGQEKAIVAALDEFVVTAKGVSSNLRSARSEIGAALREEHFDATRVDTVFSHHAGDIATLKTAVTIALSKVHEALDQDQRQRLSRFVESGPGFGFGFA